MILKYFLCIIAILLGTLQGIHSASLRCYNGSPYSYFESSFENAGSLLSQACYNSSRTCNGICAVGYTAKSNGSTAIDCLESFLYLSCNTFLLNWELEASTLELGSVSLPVTYPATVLLEMRLVGYNFATKAVPDMVKSGFSTFITTLVGHSLGAHLMGIVGRTSIQEQNITFSRIVGEDPAGPLFYNSSESLDKHCATFVDCFHTDYGFYGVNASYCTVDHFVVQDANGTQPGCNNGTQLEIHSCNHGRATLLFRDGVLRPYSLIGASAATLSQWLSGGGDASNRAYIGYYVNMSARGNYYTRPTNPTAPYGQGEAGLYP